MKIKIAAMARIVDLHKKWLNEPKYRTAYVALEEGFVLAPAVIDSRNLAGLTQKKLARKIGTTQPVVACLKIGRSIQYSCAPPNLCGQEGETMSKSTYPLKLPLSTKKAAQRPAKEDGVSLNQWIVAGVAEKVGVVETAAEFFKRRAQGATGKGLATFLRKARKVAPDPEDTVRKQ